METSGSHVHLPFFKIIRQLRGCYDEKVRFDNPETPENGSTNTIIVMDECVARLHDPSQQYRTKDYVLVECHILDTLEKLGFAGSPRVIKTKEGNHLFEWSYGEMHGHGIVFTRMSGKPLTNVTQESSKKVGSLLGEFHACLKDQKIFNQSNDEVVRIKSSKEPTYIEGIIKQGYETAKLLVDRDPFQHAKESSSLLLELCANAEKEGEAPEGILHLDLNKTNVIVDEETNTFSLVDWDFAQPGVLLLDVAFAVVEYATVDSKWNQVLAKEFLEEYNRKRPFEKGEMSSFKKYFSVQWLRTLTWVYKANHFGSKELMLYGTMMESIAQQVLEHCEELVDSFL